MENFKLKSTVSHVDDIKNEGIVSIAISRFDIEDNVGDIIRKGAFAKTFREQKSKIKHVTNHKWTMDDIVGTPLTMTESDKYAIVESKLITSITKGRELFEMYKHFADVGSDMEHSFAYRTIKTNQNKEIKGEDIVELAMKEYSTVFAGCNPHTPMLGLKDDEQGAIKAINDLEVLLRGVDFSEETGKQIESIISRIKGHSIEEEPETLITKEPSFTIDELTSILTKNFKLL